MKSVDVMSHTDQPYRTGRQELSHLVAVFMITLLLGACDGDDGEPGAAGPPGPPGPPSGVNI
ncbi:MAG: hypothetical protein L0Y45_11790, partial [Woeseiaceae bacterium]|nr:hypothetical protein [Woeseiaceae bacterium]